METTNQTHVDLEEGGGINHNSETNIVDLTEEEEKRIDLYASLEVIVDLEGGLVDVDHEELDGKVDFLELVNSSNGKGRGCRICHLSFDDDEERLNSELGCSCKGDLALAHNHCAQTWFNIRGNKTCEICGSLACNVLGGLGGGREAELDVGSSTAVAIEVSTMMLPRQQTDDRRSFWKGHRFLNFLLACMVFAFVISWLFHFNLPS
ncbi:uncharacterized protein LOC124941384 [Impatiens glandulifera]|uniref:uncharacterized protein LOC124941384 n=1 Tax=Impatiens glandulifera TaxID=253017 RepID=UPI001FB0C904|nr:uncharacterized protein LOC124941384 [Impatiens glandulifera]